MDRLLCEMILKKGGRKERKRERELGKEVVDSNRKLKRQERRVVLVVEIVLVRHLLLVLRSLHRRSHLPNLGDLCVEEEEREGFEQLVVGRSD